MSDIPWALYARVSRDDQNTEQQIVLLKDYALARGYSVRSYIDHGISGSIEDRPNYQKMLRRLREGKHAGILTVRVDRIARNIRISLDFWDMLRETKLPFSTVYEGDFRYDDGDDFFRFMIYALLADRERMLLISRTKIGVGRAKAEGKYLGGKKGRKWKKNMPP